MESLDSSHVQLHGVLPKVPVSTKCSLLESWTMRFDELQKVQLVNYEQSQVLGGLNMFFPNWNGWSASIFGKAYNQSTTNNYKLLNNCSIISNIVITASISALTHPAIQPRRRCRALVPKMSRPGQGRSRTQVPPSKLRRGDTVTICQALVIRSLCLFMFVCCCLLNKSGRTSWKEAPNSGWYLESFERNWRIWGWGAATYYTNHIQST